MAITDSNPAATAADIRPIKQFVLWALEANEFRVESNDERLYTLHVPHDRPELFHGASSVRFSFHSNGRTDSLTEYAALDTRMFNWVVRNLRQRETLVASVPKQQPESIHELTPKLFAAYQVEGGTARLAGCALEDRPLLRLTYRVTEQEGTEAALQHLSVNLDGSLLDDLLFQRMHLDELQPSKRFAKRLQALDVDSWLKLGQQAAEQQLHPGCAEFLVATVVWCKYARGKLTFSVGEQSVDVSFEGWATLIADGYQAPPPYRCPLTNLESYRLMSTDDGRITVAEAVARCDESGRQVLADELRTCDASGRQVLPDYLETCPVSQRQVARSSMTRCATCQQMVSSPEIRANRCSACRTLAVVHKDQPPVAGALERYPQLKQWRWWRFSETQTCYILEAASVTKRLLLALDKDSLDVLHLSTGSRIFSRWKAVPPEQWSDWLQTQSKEH